MYQVMFIEEDEMTRNIKLKNLASGTIDECFDDSEIVSDKCFDFMEIGMEYKCKIKLLGNVVKEMQDKVVVCKVVCREIIIGTRNMVKVIIDKDEYYIPQKKLGDFVNTDSFYFKYTRKDLIQVNDVIHGDLL